MGDLETLAKARRELEDLYLGVDDDFVNLTFEDLSNVQPHTLSSSLDKKIMSDHIAISKSEEPLPSRALNKFPSLDFSKAFENTVENNYHTNVHQNHHRPQKHVMEQNVMLHGHSDHHHESILQGHSSHHHATLMDVHGHHNYRRRAGIPHSNICTFCNTYLYLFRHRCLVCGRVYCRQCVGIGMGEMSEGRKCIECLGRRFSQRYIKRAGKMGCCMGYQRRVKQQELVWAEKGPRRIVEGHSSPTEISHVIVHSPPSFMMRSPYSSAHYPL
ncbi:unnamed protein product [Withania somnifera]